MSDLMPPADVRADGRTMAIGSGWMVAMRWALRGIGFVSTMILARLLAPQDFGLVAKAMLVIGMLEIMADTGQRLAVVRHKQPTRAHYDTAWTIGIIVNGTLAAAMFAAAPLAQLVFHEAAAVPLVRILALRTLLNGMENIGTVDFRRNMQFSTGSGQHRNEADVSR
jgi:O-antigen/teichoic acid export membrane protein